MSETNDNQASPSSHPPPEPSSLRPNHVYLRVIYLVTGNPRPPHNLGQVNLDTTVSALKDRIQNDLPEHPAPSEQRLIYQGRPLLRNESTLKEVLRLDVGQRIAGPCVIWLTSLKVRRCRWSSTIHNSHRDSSPSRCSFNSKCARHGQPSCRTSAAPGSFEPDQSGRGFCSKASRVARSDTAANRGEQSRFGECATENWFSASPYCERPTYPCCSCIKRPSRVCCTIASPFHRWASLGAATCRSSQ